MLSFFQKNKNIIENVFFIQNYYCFSVVKKFKNINFLKFRKQNNVGKNYLVFFRIMHS